MEKSVPPQIYKITMVKVYSQIVYITCQNNDKLNSKYSYQTTWLHYMAVIKTDASCSSLFYTSHSST